ncbi:lipase 1-like [Armigeres subalbatus]|uniref:lipase 1-like n=1 Tax=Armigeres subalbatus TaxID=124917 RepID=UPI002ED45D20
MFRSKMVFHRHSMLLVFGLTLVASTGAMSQTISNAARYGLHPQKYQTLTEDGYQLVMYRMKPKTASRGAVLLQHGLRQSSADWLLINRNLPRQLLDAGLEVWLGNSRASPETASNEHHSKNSEPYWNFSFHEIGYYDLPAMIDTVLMISGRSQLHLVGYSEGSTAAVALLSERPSYNRKIASLNLIAPATYMINSQVRQYAHFHDLFREIVPWTLQEIVTGSDEPSVNSAKQLEHFQQLLLSERFGQYDYGTAWDNQKRYGMDRPPPYALWKITTPVTLHYGTDDEIVPPGDVLNLAQQLHKSASVRIVKHDGIDHRGFMRRSDAAGVMYSRVVGSILEWVH